MASKPRPRGTCPVCGAERALRGNGMLQHHLRVYRKYYRAGVCPGTGQPPMPDSTQEVTVTEQPAAPAADDEALTEIGQILGTTTGRVGSLARLVRDLASEREWATTSLERIRELCAGRPDLAPIAEAATVEPDPLQARIDAALRLCSKYATGQLDGEMVPSVHAIVVAEIRAALTGGGA